MSDMLTTWTTPFVEAKDEFIEWCKQLTERPEYEDLLRLAITITSTTTTMESCIRSRSTCCNGCG